MPFKYSCYLSYPHSKNRLLERFTKQFSDSLSGEIRMYLEQPVYLDRERLDAGEPWTNEREVAATICRSVCLVPILTPIYFMSKYCLREYAAMRALEERRLALLPDRDRAGLIVPIVFRGANSLPPEIKNRRHYFDFSNFLLSDRELHSHPVFHVQIQEVADYVFKLYKAFEALPEDVSADCQGFELPREEELGRWLRDFSPAEPNPPFPFFGARQ